MARGGARTPTVLAMACFLDVMGRAQEAVVFGDPELWGTTGVPSAPSAGLCGEVTCEDTYKHGS